MKKKILFLSQVFPYPADGGGKIKTLNTLTALAKNYDVFAIFISEKSPTISELTYLTNKIGVSKIKVFYDQEILSSVKDDLLNLFAHFIRGIPHYVFQYTHKAAFEFISQSISSYNPDVIHIDHLNIAQYLPKEKRQIWILEQHNVEFYLLWTRFLHSERISRKLYLLIESTLTYLYERRTLPMFDHILAISKVEENRMKTAFGLSNITTQPLVYPLIKGIRVPKKSDILFVGGLGWPPNEDAVEWFIKEMLPAVIKEVPSVKLHIIGKSNPSLSVRLPKNKHIITYGFIQNIKPFLNKATVSILPFRMGGGVRLKALTSLAHGIPTVSTPLGVEGLDVKHNQEILIARNPKEFSSHLITVLTNKNLQNELSTNAKRYMKKYHSISKNEDFLRMYHQIILQYQK